MRCTVSLSACGALKCDSPLSGAGGEDSKLVLVPQGEVSVAEDERLRQRLLERKRVFPRRGERPGECVQVELLANLSDAASDSSAHTHDQTEELSTVSSRRVS